MSTVNFTLDAYSVTKMLVEETRRLKKTKENISRLGCKMKGTNYLKLVEEIYRFQEAK